MHTDFGLIYALGMIAKLCAAEALLGAACILNMTQACLMDPRSKSHDMLPMLGVLSKVQQRQVKTPYTVDACIVDDQVTEKFAKYLCPFQTAVEFALMRCRHSANNMLALIGIYSSAVLLKKSESSLQAVSWVPDLTAAHSAMQELLQQLNVHGGKLLSQGTAAAFNHEGASLSQLAQAVLSGISVLRKAVQCNITKSNDAGL